MVIRAFQAENAIIKLPILNFGNDKSFPIQNKRSMLKFKICTPNVKTITMIKFNTHIFFKKWATPTLHAFLNEQVVLELFHDP